MKREPSLQRAWGALGVLIFAAAWQGAYLIWGPFVLPSLGQTAAAVIGIAVDGEIGPAVLSTGVQALAGWIIAALAGCALGVLGGYVPAVGSTLTPLSTMILGTPPIVWVVLALLWYGPGSIEPAFTVVMATLPMIFAATLAGVRCRDANLDEMARVYAVPRAMRVTDILLPQLATHVMPALATALAYSWKVAIMAEVLGGGTGIGGKLETARANLDLPETMAWIVVILAFILVSDGLLLWPLRRRLYARSPSSDGVAVGP